MAVVWRPASTSADGHPDYVSHAFGGNVFGALAGLSIPALLLDFAGTVLDRTPALEALLRDEPQRDRLAASAAVCSRTLGCVARHPGAGPSAPARTPAVSWDVTLNRRAYTMRALPIRDERSRRAAVVVAIERHEEVLLPARETLLTAYGLTAREAEVARLLAAGASDRDAAARLGISVHTVRKHAEHVFTKLGIHSRKALALQLTSLGARHDRTLASTSPVLAGDLQTARVRS